MPPPMIARNDIGGKDSGNEPAKHLMNSLGTTGLNGAKKVELVKVLKLMQMFFSGTRCNLVNQFAIYFMVPFWRVPGSSLSILRFITWLATTQLPQLVYWFKTFLKHYVTVCSCTCLNLIFINQVSMGFLCKPRPHHLKKQLNYPNFVTAILILRPKWPTTTLGFQEATATFPTCLTCQNHQAKGEWLRKTWHRP